MKRIIIYLFIVFAITVGSCKKSPKNIINGTVSVSFRCTDDESKLPATIDATIKSNLHFTGDQHIGDKKTITLNRNGFTYTGNYGLSAGNIPNASPTHWDTPVIDNNVCAEVECDGNDETCEFSLVTIPRTIPYTNPVQYDISNSCVCNN